MAYSNASSILSGFNPSVSIGFDKSKITNFKNSFWDLEDKALGLVFSDTLPLWSDLIRKGWCSQEAKRWGNSFKYQLNVTETSIQRIMSKAINEIKELTNQYYRAYGGIGTLSFGANYRSDVKYSGKDGWGMFDFMSEKNGQVFINTKLSESLRTIINGSGKGSKRYITDYLYTKAGYILPNTNPVIGRDEEKFMNTVLKITDKAIDDIVVLVDGLGKQIMSKLSSESLKIQAAANKLKK